MFWFCISSYHRSGFSLERLLDDAYFCFTQLWSGFGPPGVAVWETVWNPLTLFSLIWAELKVCRNEEKGNLVLVLGFLISSLNSHEMCLQQLERWSTIASMKRRNMMVNKNLDLWTAMISIRQEEKRGRLGWKLDLIIIYLENTWLHCSHEQSEIKYLHVGG